MEIKVKLFASLRVGRFREEAREYPCGARIGDVAKDLGIPEEDLGIVLLNGRHASIDDSFCEGDTVSLLPRVGGG